MKKRRTMKWILLAAVIILTLCCTAAFAEDKFANGEEKTVTALNPADRDSVYGGKLNGTAASSRLTVDTATIPIREAFGGGKASIGDTSDNAQTSTASVSGDAQLSLMMGYKGESYSWCEVYGGGYASAKGTHTVLGSTNIQMKNPNAAAELIYGGGYAYGFVDMPAKSTVKRNTSIILTQGNVKGGPHFAVAGGGRADNYGDASVEGNTSIEISGNVTVGNQNEPRCIFGGGIAEDHCIAKVGGSTGITISGGKLDRINVYGGGKVGFNGNGSHADVSGDALITIQGAEGLKATAGVWSLNGGGLNMSTVDHESCTADVKGKKYLVFDNAGKGTVRADIKDFDVIKFKGENSITFIEPLSSDVKSVVLEGSAADGTIILTLAEGSHKPEIVGTNARWDGMKLVAGEGKEAPAEPTEPKFNEDIKNVISKDVAAVKPAVSTDKTAVAAELSGIGIESSDLGEDAEGNIILNKDTVVTAGGAYSNAYMLPIFTAVKTAGSTAEIIACSFMVNKADLLAAKPEEVKLLKIKGKTSSLLFKYSDKAEDFLKDGCFTVQTSDDKIAPRAGALTEDKYKVTVFIKDNGLYDLDETSGSILDPAAIVKTSEGGSSGGSSGCSAGFGALALLAIVPIIVRRKRDK